MIKLIYIMGKSSTGKDTIKTELIKKLNNENYNIRELVLYTTREKRVNEVDGVDYYFVDETQYKHMLDNSQIIEARTYHKVQGKVRYFTVLNENNIDKSSDFIISIGTLESYTNMCSYLSKQEALNLEIMPVYLEVDNKKRFDRAMKREQQEPETEQNFDEVKRRYEADEIDFSENNLAESDIKIRFKNDSISDTIENIYNYIR